MCGISHLFCVLRAALVIALQRLSRVSSRVIKPTSRTVRDKHVSLRNLGSMDGKIDGWENRWMEIRERELDSSSRFNGATAIREQARTQASCAIPLSEKAESTAEISVSFFPLSSFLFCFAAAGVLRRGETAEEPHRRAMRSLAPRS